jgi:hypothetical protein
MACFLLATFISSEFVSVQFEEICQELEVYNRYNHRLHSTQTVNGHFLTYIHIGFFRPTLLRVGCSPSPFHSIYPLNSSYVAPSTPYPYSKTTQPLCPSLWVLVTFHHRWAQLATVRRIYMHYQSTLSVIGCRIDKSCIVSLSLS